jgi:hypothetical protein
MIDLGPLERRYRRLLALYPKTFRAEHEQEMLTVLMDGARDGQELPRPGEAVDLVRGALLMRLRRTRVPSTWEYRHAALMLPVRVATAIWLLFLTFELYTNDRGGWWGVLLVPAAVLHLYIAYRLIRRPPQASRPAR